MVVEVVMIPWSFKILFLLLLQKFEIAYDKKKTFLNYENFEFSLLYTHACSILKSNFYQKSLTTTDTPERGTCV